MTTNLSRRGLLGALICAPAIVRASSLMPVKAIKDWVPLWTAQYGPLPQIGDLVTISGMSKPIGIITRIVTSGEGDVAVSHNATLRLLSAGLERFGERAHIL